MTIFSLCPHPVFALCVCTTDVSAYRNTSHIEVGLHPVTSFNFNFLHKGPISIQLSWELGLQNMKFGGHNSVRNTSVLHPVKFLPSFSLLPYLPSPSFPPLSSSSFSLSLLLLFPLSFFRLRAYHILPSVLGMERERCSSLPQDMTSYWEGASWDCQVLR